MGNGTPAGLFPHLKDQRLGEPKNKANAHIRVFDAIVRMVLRQQKQSAMTLDRSYDRLSGSRRNILLQKIGACRQALALDRAHKWCGGKQMEKMVENGGNWSKMACGNAEQAEHCLATVRLHSGQAALSKDGALAPPQRTYAQKMRLSGLRCRWHRHRSRLTPV